MFQHLKTTLSSIFKSVAVARDKQSFSTREIITEPAYWIDDLRKIMAERMKKKVEDGAIITDADGSALNAFLHQETLMVMAKASELAKRYRAEALSIRESLMLDPPAALIDTLWRAKDGEWKIRFAQQGGQA